jgi:polyisoprenoid-binding protein YceI
VKEISVTATTPGHQFLPAGLPRLAVGSWRVDPARSYASFAARRVLITEPIEDSTAAGRQDERHQHRVTSAGPRAGRAGFLDAVTYPEISFRSELLAWVPAGWRTVGCLNLRGHRA